MWLRGPQWDSELEGSFFTKTGSNTAPAPDFKFPDSLQGFGDLRPLDFYAKKPGFLTIIPGFFTSNKNPKLKLYEQYVVPTFLFEKNQQALKANLPHSKTILLTVQCVHGLGEYCCRYLEFMERMVEKFLNFSQQPGVNVNVIPVFNSFDFRGHGRSGGKRTFFGPLHLSLMVDLKQVLEERLPKFIEFQKSEYSGILPNFEQKTVLFCHSLGTLVTFLTDSFFGIEKITGIKTIVATGSLTGLDPKIKKNPVFPLLPYIAEFLPGFPVQPIDSTTLTFNEENNNNYATDPLVVKRAICCRPSAAIAEGIQKLVQEENILNIKTSNYLFLHGAQDLLANPDALKEFFERIKNVKNKRMQIFPDLRHEIGFEKYEDSEKVIKEMFDWFLENEILPPKQKSATQGSEENEKAL